MALSDIDAVRLKTGDKSVITREISIGDGVKTVYKLGHENLQGLQIWVNEVLQVVDTQYTADTALGVITFASPPGLNIEIIFQYYWTQYSDEEVQYFLSEAGSINLAASLLLYALAADAAKVAMRETLAGGGSFGSVTRDTSLTAQELRETAKALKNLYEETELGDQFPAQALTEVAWTNQVAEELFEQEFIREHL